MKILIIATNRNQNPFAVMPLGACLIAEDAERAGHEVRLLDLMYEKDPLRAVEHELRESTPDFVGLSARNIDNNDMQNPKAFFNDLPPIIKIIRENSNAGIILGGAAVGVMPEAFLRYTGISYAVIGNGEGTFPKLVGALSRGETVSDITGVAWIDDGIYNNNGSSVSRDSDCRIPDFNRWIDARVYISHLSSVPVQSKRGCPFECVYCTYAINEGRDYHLCPPGQVVETVKRLVSEGLRDIEFVDNVFNSPYEHAMEICRELAKASLGARFQSIEINPAFLDDPLLSAMDDAGFVGIGITAESASDPVLSGLKKGYDSRQVRLAAQVIKRHNVPCIWMFLLGGPGETEQTVRETLAFAGEYVKPGDAAFFNVGIRIYPGTGIEKIARDEGVLLSSREDMFAPVFYVSPGVKMEWLKSALKKSMAEHPNFLDSDSIGLPALPALYRLGYGLGMRQPVWRYSRMIMGGMRSLGLKV